MARRAYGIDEIALVPGVRTLDPSLADTHWTIAGIERDIPIIASAMDGVVDVKMAVLLSELGALGVLNLEGIQTRYEDPNPILDRIASVGKSEFVGLMQELYQEPIKPELVALRIQDIKAQGAIAAVSLTPVGASRFGQVVAQAQADLLFIQATVVSTAHLAPEAIAPLDLHRFCQEMPIPVILGNCVTYEVALNLMKTGAAAILVGIGFGIQDVFKDYVAGFVLLFEAKLRVGDIVQITPVSKGNTKSFETIVAKILKINLRTTEIQTREGNILIIPNTRLTQEQVENWSHGSELTLFTIKITVEYGSNTELIQHLLKQAALAHPNVNKNEPVMVRLADFAESGLELELIFWADQSWDINNYKSEIRFEIDRLFREYNIKIPYPQRVMHVMHESSNTSSQQ